VICLDTNYLVRGLVKGSKESAGLVRCYQSNEPLMSAAPAWYEFLSGPVASRHIQIVRVIAFEEVQAIEAARLFTAVGRTRRLRTDAMIAATAIVAGPRLATSNAEDFEAIVPHGLTIVQ
jgi:predicted nucleic acid-binding protein